MINKFGPRAVVLVMVVWLVWGGPPWFAPVPAGGGTGGWAARWPGWRTVRDGRWCAVRGAGRWGRKAEDQAGD